MAEIYKIPQGTFSRGRDRLNFVAAHHEETGARLEIEADAVFSRAAAVLKKHRYSGESHILHERGDVDHYIVLESEDAGYIEYANDDAVSPLRKAIRVV